MSKVNKSDIDQFIADSDLGQKLGLSVRDVDALSDMFLNQIIDQVDQLGEVDLHRFGTFTKALRKARNGRNPKTGEKISIPAKNVVKFKPFKAFRDGVL